MDVSASRSRAAIGLALLIGLPACVSPGGSTFEDSPLVRPGAKIELGTITATPEVEAELADAVAMMRTALSEALEERGIAWHGDARDDRFLLEVRLADYEKGNAFKRWLVPGYGTTLLAVEGRLVDRRDGSEAGRLDHRRTVAWGGAYSIGAWRTVFASVAEDVSGELENRIEGKGFVVALQPWATRESEVPRSEHPIVFHVGAVRDSRPHRGRIGEREALGASMGEVFFSRGVPEFLRETITDELLAQGHRLGEPGEGDALELDVREFWVETDSTALYWDVIGTVELDVAVGSRTFRASGRGTARTYVWPGVGVMSEALDEAVTGAVLSLRSAPDWPL